MAQTGNNTNSLKRKRPDIDLSKPVGFTAASDQSPPAKKLKMDTVSNNNDNNSEIEIIHPLTSRQLRKQDRTGFTQKERNLYKRKMKKKRKKEKLQQMTEQERIKYSLDKFEKRKLKNKQKEIINSKLINANKNGMKICIDLSFNNLYNKQMEYTNIIKQLCYCHNSNKTAAIADNYKSVSFHLLNVDNNWKSYFNKQGIYGWKGLNIHHNKDVIDVFNSVSEKQNIIYLSPDSDNVLDENDFKLNNKKYIFIIGGIVDRTIKKELSLNRAKQLQIKHAKLPLHLIDLNGRNALNINNVFKILIRFQNNNEMWKDILNEEITNRNKIDNKSKKERRKRSLNNNNNNNNDDNDNQPIKPMFIPRSLHRK